MRLPIFYDVARLNKGYVFKVKLACSATETSYTIETLKIAILDKANKKGAGLPIFCSSAAMSGFLPAWPIYKGPSSMINHKAIIQFIFIIVQITFLWLMHSLSDKQV